MVDKKLSPEKKIGDFFSLLLHKRVITIFLLGFTVNIGYIISFNNIRTIIDKAHLETYYNNMLTLWPIAIYSCRFLLAPMIDRISLPILSNNIGRRRSWLVVSQVVTFISVVAIAIIDPQKHFNLFSLVIFLLSIFISIQLLVIDAVRIESGYKNLQPTMITAFLCSYYLSAYVFDSTVSISENILASDGNFNFKAWSMVFIFMSVIMLFSIFVTLKMKDPENDEDLSLLPYSTNDYMQASIIYLFCVILFFIIFNLTLNYMLKDIRAFLTHFGISLSLISHLKYAISFMISFIVFILSLNIIGVFKILPKGLFESITFRPITDLFNRFKSNTFSIIVLVISYRIPELVANYMYEDFYHNSGYNEEILNNVNNVVVPVATILGALLAGIFSLYFSAIKALLHGAIFSCLGSSIMLLIVSNKINMSTPYLLTGIENLFYGFSYVIFITMLSIIVSRSYSATQFVILYSISAIPAKFLDNYIHSIINSSGHVEVLFLCIIFSAFVIWLSNNVKDYLIEKFSIY